jgi:hypothetical protein
MGFLQCKYLPLSSGKPNPCLGKPFKKTKKCYNKPMLKIRIQVNHRAVQEYFFFSEFEPLYAMNIWHEISQ